MTDVNFESDVWSRLTPDMRYNLMRYFAVMYDETLAKVYEDGIIPIDEKMTFDRVFGSDVQSVNAAFIRAYGGKATDPFIWDSFYKSLNLPFDPDTVSATPHNHHRARQEFKLVDRREKNNDLPDLMVLGYARHGKDTVCELLEEMYGFRWVSSSMKCAEKVLLRLLEDVDFASGFVRSLPEDLRYHLAQRLYNLRTSDIMHEDNSTADRVHLLFEARGEDRPLWYQAIKWYNAEDKSLLCREIMEEADIYCGLRDAAELNAVYNLGLVDDVIWVDASQRHEPEPASSMTVQPHHATLHLDNNGTIEQLKVAIAQMMYGQYGLLPYQDDWE